MMYVVIYRIVEIAPRFKHSKTAATGPLPIERAFKTDVVSILAVYQQLF